MTFVAAEQDPTFRRLITVFTWLTLIVCCGTIGYMLLEGWGVLDGFFMTVITLSTVGYGETHELTRSGRWFTSALIFSCMVGMTFWTAALTSFIIENDLGGHFQRRRILRMIAKLQNHTIVCGADMMARVIIEKLMQRGLSVVVVDEDEENLESVRKRFHTALTIQGLPTSEMTLAQANILESQSVVAALDSEVDNLLVGITCKDLGKDVTVYARCDTPNIANRMRKAGIDEVISPASICGDRVAEMILA